MRIGSVLSTAVWARFRRIVAVASVARARSSSASRMKRGFCSEVSMPKVSSAPLAVS